MNATSSMQISQVGPGSGGVGESFRDGVSADAGGGLSAVITVENTNPQTSVTDFALLWVPHDSSGTKLDTDGESTLFKTGAHTAQFQVTAGVWGHWRIRQREVVGGENQDEIRIFGVKSPNGVEDIAYNEDSDPTANLLNATPAQVRENEDNQGGGINGWQRVLRLFAEKLEAQASVADNTMIAGLVWSFDTATADADPGDGNFRLDAGSYGGATQIFLDDASDNGAGNGENLLADLIAESDYLYIEQMNDPSRFVLYQLGPGFTTATGYSKIDVGSLVDNGALFDNGAKCAVTLHKQVPASFGEALLGTTWEFDTVDQVDSDPGSGKFKMNNASQTAATELYIDTQSKSGAELSDMLTTLDSGAWLYLQQKGDATRWAFYQVTGAAVGNSGNFGWVTVPVSHNGATSGAAIQDAEDVELLLLLGPGGGGGGVSFDVEGQVQTTDATSTILGSYVTLANNRSIELRGSVVAKGPGDSDAQAFEVHALATRGASAAAVVINHVDVKKIGAVVKDWDVEIDENGAGTIRVRVVGEAATTIEWNGRLFAQESH